MDMDKIIDHFNWATCDGLKESGIGYWSYKNENDMISIYFKNQLFYSFINAFNNPTQLVSTLIIKANQSKDKDLKRFIKYIRDIY